MSKTAENLQHAFSGESQVNRKYLAYAQKAEDDGYPQVAKLFRAISAAESIHALNHLRIMGDVKSTAENLEQAIRDENYEVTTMYPEFMQDAEHEEEKKALRSFRWAWEVEKVHEDLFTEALKNLGEEAAEFDVYVCPVCGHTHIGLPPERCPVCATPRERYLMVD